MFKIPPMKTLSVSMLISLSLLLTGCLGANSNEEVAPTEEDVLMEETVADENENDESSSNEVLPIEGDDGLTNAHEDEEEPAEEVEESEEPAHKPTEGNLMPPPDEID